MSADPSPSLDDEAVAILKANDRGCYSVPTKGLYPFQWNWDSAFAALGYAHVDPERAIVELETLAASQWPDGMIPHIIFHKEDPGYFPGATVWATPHSPPTSGITQPPILAIAVARLAALGLIEGARLERLLDAAANWHRWFLAARHDDATGAVGVVHPWESGRDNMPDWDEPLFAVNADNVAPFERRDLGHVDPAMRPTQDEYVRYMALVEFGRALEWNQAELILTSPFFVADPGMTAMLIAAERALASSADTIGRTDLAHAAAERLSRLERGLDALWSDEAGGYTTRDARTGRRGRAVSSATFLAFAAGPLPLGRLSRLCEEFDRLAGECQFMVPSYDPASQAFDERRYWRGPVWLVVNWLIALGLEAHGDTRRADRVRSDSRRLVEMHGFYEYFSPLTGDPLGGGDFTWTAAAWLDFARG